MPPGIFLQIHLSYLSVKETRKTMNYLIAIIILIIIAGICVSIALAIEGDSYCANDTLMNGTTYLEYCLLGNKVISCSQNMTACIEAKEELEKK